jgi:SAM-dependent methyltransferase/uncharacterized protein YbaR (Trm112 family)
MVTATDQLEDWYLENLVCPIDHGQLQFVGERLICRNAHSYPVVQGIPVMLLDNIEQTIEVAHQTLALAKVANNQVSDDKTGSTTNYLATLGIGDEGRQRLLNQGKGSTFTIDPVVSELIGATNGIMYQHLIGKLNAYPIPELRWPLGEGKRLLDVGCNWGRWCIAAARKEYEVVGIDPSLGAILAARRVSLSLGLTIRLVVADARYLPFPCESFERVFSYSVLQHFSRTDCQKAVQEIGRVLGNNGESMIQMPTAFGIRCLFHQIKRGFREARGFEVRYWTLNALEKLFTQAVGKSRFSVDCYFGIGLQASDAHLMPGKLRAVLRASELLRKLSAYVPLMRYFADSIYVNSNRTSLKKQ